MNKIITKEKALIKKLKNKTNKHVSNNKIFTLFDFIFSICFIIVLTLGFIFAPKIDKKINNVQNEISNRISIEAGVKAHFLDVGQAGCVIIELPNNKILMYDTGLETTSEKIVNYIKKNIKTRVIDYLILSHTDSDHIGGACAILENFKINNIVRPVVKSTHTNFDESLNYININEFSTLNEPLYANVLNKIYQENATVFVADYKNIEQLNNVFDGDECNIEFYLPYYYTSSNMNDFSSIITITYMGKTLMLTGDATERTEKNILKNYSVPDIDFLLLAHHGSNTSSSFEFLQKTLPEYVYVSVGKDNSFNHPHTETLNKLDYLGVKYEKIYLTANCGDIILAFNGSVVENYFNAYKIRINLILTGIGLIILIAYIPKLKKFIKHIVKKKRKKAVK